jgi:hypothetical protein
MTITTKRVLATEAERDARIARLLATATQQQQAAAAQRNARVAELFKQVEATERWTWRRTAEVKGPGGDTADAVLARLGVIDRQGDIIDPGCLRNPPGDRVPVSEWNHSYLRDPDAPAAGFATVQEQEGELRARVTFSDTPEGRASAQRVHETLPDWSWGLAEIETRPVTAAERAAGALRAIAKVRVIEVSPVDKGASVASGTLSSHCASCALAGSDKCAACLAGAGLTPCHPRRRALEARVTALSATAATLDAADGLPPQHRYRRALDRMVDTLAARQEQLDAAWAARDERRQARAAAILERQAQEDAALDERLATAERLALRAAHGGELPRRGRAIPNRHLEGVR